MQYIFFIFSGKDDKGWSMYIDSKRSWFMKNDVHSDRTDGGIKRGGVIGILLDLDRHTLSYFVNGETHGPLAFTKLNGVFYPAVSLNRDVQVTLHSGLSPPLVLEESDDSP